VAVAVAVATEAVAAAAVVTAADAAAADGAVAPGVEGDDSEMSIAVEIADERAARSSRVGWKASRGGCGREAEKTAAGSTRKSSKRGRRGLKTADG